MKATTWSAIYNALETMKEEVVLLRGILRAPHTTNVVGLTQRGAEGICVMGDNLALKYQYLERIQRHVGCHGFAQRDREHGMKRAQCVYRLKGEA